MKRARLLALAFGIVAVFAAHSPTHAHGPIYVEGSRDLVRAVCVGDAKYLTEGENYSICSDDGRGTSLHCDDAGECSNAGFNLGVVTGSTTGDPSGRAANSSEEIAWGE